MKLRFLVALAGIACAPGQGQQGTEKQARQTISAMRVNGQVGGSLDLRVTGTDKSYSYKLRATWLTPQVLDAAGRILETAKGLSAAEAQRVLKELTAEPAHYVLVELDPREGSGVIPRDWLSRFGPKGIADRQVTGQVVPEQGNWRTLMGAFPRDYAYDIFIVRFPVDVREGVKTLEASDAQAELSVRIYNKMGVVTWRVPAETGR